MIYAIASCYSTLYPEMIYFINVVYKLLMDLAGQLILIKIQRMN
jgi:hypothetical protein